MEKVKPRYTTRKAANYSRQSTLGQVVRNVGSRKYQEAQTEHALRLGWAAENIVAFEDLGLSGTTADRPGYQKLIQMIEQGEVGAVFISDMTRGGRDPEEWFRFLHLMEQHDVLLVVDGRVTDLNDSAQVFVKEIEAVVTGRENRMRAETMHRGRIAKIRQGSAVTRPPIGYQAVYERRGDAIVKTGKWIKDPDPRIQAAIHAVFRAFEEKRSLVQACRELKRQGILIPARRGNGVAWVEATVHRIRYLIKHPAYYGAYVYGREHKRRAERGRGGR